MQKKNKKVKDLLTIDDKVVYDFSGSYDFNSYMYFMEDIFKSFTTNEIRFFREKLNITEDSVLLDVPCGYGRHANILAGLIKKVVGVDSNENFIMKAQRDAEECGIANVDYVVSDMRNINYNREFTHLILMGTSFGMFDHKDNLTVLRKLITSLKDSGIFCIELINPEATGSKYWVFDKEKNLLIDKMYFDKVHNRFFTERTYILNGKRTDTIVSVEVFSLKQFQVIVEAMGAKIIDVYGMNGSLFTSNSGTMIVIGQKN